MSTDKPTPSDSERSDDEGKYRPYLLAGLAVLVLLSASALVMMAGDTDAPTPEPDTEPAPAQETESETNTEETRFSGANIDIRAVYTDAGKAGWNVTYTGDEPRNASAANLYVYDTETHGPYTWQELSENGSDTIEPGDSVLVTEENIPGNEFDVDQAEGGILLTYQYSHMDSCTPVAGLDAGNSELDAIRETIDC